eukprot:TRINITY_DN2075_c0_g1_i3.p2 TRINITY_DN2075_c0_g1~~TRINITY_DN2075_c0_g1_i3.p2  ORF type:complete len:166 (-),score=58.36 TRINITY_DN2075_c0_g1_i3:121-618(-)
MLRTVVALLLAPSAVVDARFLGSVQNRHLTLAVAANDTAPENKTEEKASGLPEQGYHGENVEHKDKQTYTGDWGKEGGWKNSSGSYAQHIHLISAANETAGNGTEEKPSGLPEQGYHGDNVEHMDRKTYTGDWGKEGGWSKKDEAESEARLKASKKAWRDHYLNK